MRRAPPNADDMRCLLAVGEWLRCDLPADEAVCVDTHANGDAVSGGVGGRIGNLCLPAHVSL